MKKTTLIIFVLVLLTLTACTQSIPDVKSEDYVGKTVSVRGTVENTLKIGSLSGYSLVDDEGNKISVSSNELPEEGTKKTVKGVLIRDTILGYYIKAD